MMEHNSLYSQELAAGDYYPKVVAYYFKQWNGYQMPYHDHNAVEIMYVISGGCRIRTLNESFELKKGDFIMLDANVAHNLAVDESLPCRMLNVEFQFVAKDGSFPSLKEQAADNSSLSQLLAMHRSYMVLRDSNDVYQTLKSLVLELDGGSNNDLMVQLLLSQLLIRIARLAVQMTEHEPALTEPYIRKAVAFMHHNYDCDIQVKEIADAVNLHPGYLHRLFKASTNQSIMAYLTALRMEKAKMLLTQTDIPIVDISGYIGVNSRQYFSSLFKKHTGHTPHAYRISIATEKWLET